MKWNLETRMTEDKKKSYLTVVVEEEAEVVKMTKSYSAATGEAGTGGGQVTEAKEKPTKSRFILLIGNLSILCALHAKNTSRLRHKNVKTDAGGTLVLPR